MFGFVRIHKPELKVKDYEAYRGVYCSLCKALGKEYSIFARFILNYDCTFLSLFIMSRNDTCMGFKEVRCRFNALRNFNSAVGAEEALSKGAALTIISSYYKLLDSIHDGGVFKKTGCTLIRPIFSIWHKKAMRKFPLYEEAVRKMYFNQLEVEGKADTCLDEAAEPTAKMLEAVLKNEANDENEAKVLSELGYHMGRWIYLMDAADDIDDDFKSGNFNPFILRFKTKENVDINEADAVISQSYYLLSRAYDLVDKRRFNDILDNIIYNGLAVKQREVLYSRKEK